MALAIIFVLLFFVLGAALGPLFLAGLSVALEDDRGQRLSEFAVGLGLKSVWKPVLMFTTSDELTLKRREFDEKHNSEYVSFGGILSSIKRTLHDPQDRFHPFYGTPFGFVDELFGVVVDPRDVLLGEQLRRKQANGQYTYAVERNNSLHESVRAVFELPEGPVGVQLSQGAALFGGSFDSQFIDRIRDIYETSQAPKGETSALKQLLAPVMAFAGIVLLSMFVAGQTGGGGGGGAPAPQPTPTENNTTIEVGLLLLFISTDRIKRRLREWYENLKQKLNELRNDGSEESADILDQNPDNDFESRSTSPGEITEDDTEEKNISWRNRLVTAALGGFAALFAFGLYIAFPPIVSPLGIPLPLGIWCFIALLLGMLVPAFVASFFGRSLGGLGMLLGKLYIIIGLLGFDKPVINLDDGQYELVEYADRDWEIEPHWYRFAMTRIGIGFPNGEDAWPDGTTMHSEKVKTLAETGDSKDAPDDCVATDAIKVDDIKGFLPDDIDDDSIHVRTDRTTGWFFEAGQARRLMESALQNAKRDYGGGEKPISQKWMLGATLASIFMASIFSWAVFF